jgi:DeoR/GlpR family transcriptional regulator of sugar metabolism
MFAVERRNKIMSHINSSKSILVQEISDLFGVTEETIRRDLKILESSGLIIRTHGGAVLADDPKVETPIEIRQGINAAGKNSIGLKASKYVNEGDTIILDASTSSLFVAKHIKDIKGLTVITNSQKILTELSNVDDIKLISTGGILRQKSLSYVGRSALNSIEYYHANKVFFSTKGFNPDRGLTDSNEQESDVRKKMLESSEQIIYLCDYTKFDKVGFITTASVADIDIIITDVAFTKEWESKLSKYKLDIITS